MNAAPALPEIAEDLRLDAENPWPGLTAFTEQQQEYFYGRGEEALELFECIKRERLTVLFGKSGLGKTSLLQAGIFPQLRNSAFLPVYVRVSYATGAHPLEFQLRAALENAIQTANLAEVALPQAGDTIWEYLHRRSANLIDFEGNTVKPVLIFDQFEEWFTLGSRKEFLDELNDSFLPGLTDLVENRTPRALAEKLARDRDLARRYDLDAPGCRILITLREDYLANLENLRHHMPSLVFIDNRMRLKEMNGRQAFSVVAEPNPDLVAPDVAEFITRFVAGTHTDGLAESERGPAGQPLEHLEVAPAILSLFCRQLNEERRRRRLPRITRELVAAQGVTIIDDFYLHCIANMHPAVRRMIEDQLLTKAGYRDNIDLSQAKWDLERAGAGSTCIDDLVRLRLLQVEEHRGIPRLELTHDVLAEPVKRSRTLWEEEQARQEEERARMLRQQQEREALTQARQAEQEARKQANYLRKVIAAVGIVAVLLAGLLVDALVERHRRINMTDLAENEAKVANANAKRANDSEKTAQENAAKADAKAKEAKESKDKADSYAAVAKDEENAVKIKNVLVTDVSSKSIQRCVKDSRAIYSLGGVLGDAVEGTRDPMYRMYERTLMGDGECFSIAQDLHKIVPESIDVTDALAMIPLRAADSARRRHDAKTLQTYCARAISLAQSLEREPDRQGLEILIARTYMLAAYELAAVNDPTASAEADRGRSHIDHARTLSRNTFNSHDWNAISDFYQYEADFQDTTNNKPGVKKAYEDAFNAELSAHTQTPADSGYLAGAVSRAIDVGDSASGIKDYSEAFGWYERALGLAREAKDRATIATIYRDMRGALVHEKKFEDAQKLVDDRIKSLKAGPVDVEQQRELAMAYADAAEVEEAQKSWSAAVGHRTQAVTVLEGLKPDDYDDRSKDLATAYLDLAWAEIYSGQMDKGMADSRNGLAVAEKIKDRDKINYVLGDTVRALLANKHYAEAHAEADKYIEALLKQPDDLQRAQALKAAYSNAAEAEENLKLWPAGVGYRAQAVDVLEKLKPDAYADRSKDLASAYLDLAWSEIYAGQLEKGLADSGKGVAVADGIKDRGKLDYVYQNTVKALLANKRYEEAHAEADKYIEVLLKQPDDLQRAQSLNTAYGKAAEAEEDLKLWPAAVGYRAQAVDVLEKLKPDDYDDRSKDLATAYLDLAWAEIYAGQMDKGMAASRNGLAVAEKIKDRDKINYVLGDTVRALLANKHYAEAHAEADKYIEALLKQPDDLQRAQALKTAYSNAAEAEEDLNLWPAAVGYRAHVVDVLEKLKPDAYDDRSKDLASADLDLAWSEIYAGQLEKGLADSGKGLAVAEAIKDRGKLDYVYQNTIRALLANKHHKEAHTLADQYIDALLKQPDDLLRAQSLNTAYGKAAEAEEDLQAWPAAIGYRSRAVTVLRDLKPDAYDGRSKDLASAYVALASAEMFGGQLEKALPDSREAIAVAETTKDRDKLADIYQSAIQAFRASKHYREARSLSDQRIQSLLSQPQDIERDRRLRAAYERSALIDEDLSDWPRAAEDYKRAVTILRPLNEKHAYDGVKTDLAAALGSLSWAEIQAGRFADGLADAKLGGAEDPTQIWITVNQADGLLLTGKTAEARALYLHVKSLPHGDRDPMKDILSDFEQICKLGYARPEMIGIAHDLGIDSPELKKCFETGLHTK